MKKADKAKEAAENAQKDAADKIKTLEAELTAAKKLKAKAEQAQKEAEAKLKALEAKAASKTPEDAKPVTK